MFLPIDYLLCFSIHVNIFLSSPVLSKIVYANLNFLFTTWWQHGAWLLRVLTVILEYTEINTAGTEKSTRQIWRSLKAT